MPKQRTVAHLDHIIAEERLIPYIITTIAVLVSVVLSLSLMIETLLFLAQSSSLAGSYSDGWILFALIICLGAAVFSAVYGVTYLSCLRRVKFTSNGIMISWVPPLSKAMRFQEYRRLPDIHILVNEDGRWILNYRLPYQGPRFLLIRPRRDRVFSALLDDEKAAYKLLESNGIPIRRKPPTS